MHSEVGTEENDPETGRPPGGRPEHHGPTLAAIAVGGGLGALARYAIACLLPPAPDGFPWATFAVNVTGCLLIGVLMVLVTEVPAAHRLVRPFLGVGVLGGFTTFSTYALEIHALLRPGTVGVALAYLGGTLVAAMLAALAGMSFARALTGRRARVPRR